MIELIIGGVIALVSGVVGLFMGCTQQPEWEAANPLIPLPAPPLGI